MKNFKSLCGQEVTAYEKDGKTVWISRFYGSGTGGGGGGNYILKCDGSGIDGEVIDESRYETRYIGNDENVELEWYRNDYYYIFGEDITEAEYGNRKKNILTAYSHLTRCMCSLQ